MIAMINKSVARIAVILLLLSLTVIDVKIAEANPTWGTSATPIPPNKDPPQIIINSPSPTEYNNPVALNITIIQPDSWVNKTIFVLPNGWVDNSDSSNNVVVGQNTLRLITCIIDGQSIIFWKGTPVGYGITYYLPKVTQFSAVMNLSKGQHNLQVNVLAESEWVTEGIIPFAGRTYLILANQSTTFRVEDGSEAPMIYDIRSSYVIWQSSSASMPSPTSAPPQPLSSQQNPTTAISFTPFIISPLNQTTYNATQVPLVYATNSKVLWSYYRLDSINSSDLKNFNGNITLPSLSEGQHELMVAVTTNISATNPTYQDMFQTIRHTVIFYVDTVAPKITDLSVNSTDTSDLLLNFTVDENTSWVGYSLDNQANVTINGNAVLRDLSNGVHNVTVYAKDSNGNIGVSETISFAVGLFPLMVVVALIATAVIVVVAVAITMLYKRRKKVCITD
jgi:hypothetical protein